MVRVRFQTSDYNDLVCQGFCSDVGMELGHFASTTRQIPQFSVTVELYRSESSKISGYRFVCIYMRGSAE